MIGYFLQRDYTHDTVVVVSFKGIHQFRNYKVHKYNWDKNENV